MTQSYLAGKGNAFTRRAFVAGATLSTLAAAGASSACTPDNGQKEDGSSDSDEAMIEPEEQAFINSCHGNCGRNCSWKVKVREGVIVNCEPYEYGEELDPENIHRGGCWKGFLNMNRIYDPDRIQYPMKRTNSKDEEPEWERISWDEAIDLLAEKWQGIVDEVGPTGFALHHVYGSSTFLSGNGGGCWGKLINATGADTVLTGADMATIWAMSMDSGVFGATPDSIRGLDTIVLWGVNAAETRWNVWRYANMARSDHGAKIISIDPNSTITALHSDQHIVINPATDGALALSVMQVVFENGWQDDEFLANRTCAPYLVKEDGTVLRGFEMGLASDDEAYSMAYVWDSSAGTAVPIAAADANNIATSGTFDVSGLTVRTALDLLKERANEYPPEVAESITGIPADVIRGLADDIANTKSTIIKDNGYAHYANSVQTALGLDTILMVTGRLAQPGCGIYYWYASAPTNPEWAAVGAPGPQIPDSKLLEVVETGKLGSTEIPLRGMLTYAGNVIGSTADRAKIEEAMRKLEFVCVVEIRMTDACAYADLLLPACHWWERDDVIMGGLATPMARVCEKAVDPQFESLSDYQICQMVAEKLGVGEFFQGSDQDQLAEALNSEANVQMGVTYADLQEKKAVRVGNDNCLVPEDGSFAAENGRVNFLIDRPFAYGGWDAALDPKVYNLPDFRQNAEALASSPLAGKYPLVLMTPHTKYGTQTTFHHAEWLHEVLEEPYVHLNPTDAQTRGVGEGDYLRLYNDRGEVVARTKINGGIMPGVAVLYHGWAKQYFKAGHYQYLSSFDNTDDFSNNSSYFDVRVEAEAYKEA